MNITRPTKVFLLGGYDLEMITLKQMLEGMEDVVVLDKLLRWEKARLSAYRDELQQYADCDIYGVELQENCEKPASYHRIDHHNDWAGRPSALEQVASIFNVTLSRDQQLIAANDRGYIPAMQALGATDSEIADIRQRDRAAQGVSREDEMLAERSVANGMSHHGCLTVVRSLTSRFSPICDRLFPYRNLLIFTDAEWMFYGEGTARLTRRLANEIGKKKVFHGGGDNGYIGAVQHAYSKDEINQFVKQIIEEYEHN